MANTILFAPIVDLQQPAVIQDNGGNFALKVYFNKSGFNSWEDIDLNEIRYTFTDPGASGGWSSSSLLLDGGPFDSAYQIPYQVAELKEDNGKAYIEITNNELKVEKIFKNKFYQVQLYFKGADSEDDFSPLSSVTLVRLIEQPSIEIEGLSVGTEKELNSFSTLSGRLTYTQDSSAVETLFSYSYKIWEKDGDDLELKYSSPIIFNQLGGLTFSSSIDFKFELESSYILSFYYTTINGYKGSQENFQFVLKDALKNVPKINFPIEVIEDSEEGGVILRATFEELSWLLKDAQGYGKLVLEKNSEYAETWKPAAVFNFSQTSVDIEVEAPLYFKWKDYTVEHGIKYKYRFSYYLNNIAQWKSQELDTVPTLSAITLSDKDTMLSILYNPNISNFKWVTQESITNTLGGRYPIVRKNAQTKYCQFSLSGTLYFAYNDNNQIDSLDRVQHIREFFLPQEESGLYFSRKRANQYADLEGAKKAELLKKKMRQEAMNFLTNGAFKLFRSSEEGNMIVYLSNISFTPNKSLGRTVYDFTATVTEVCEATEENCRKFNFNNENGEWYNYILTTTNNNPIVGGAYVDANQILNNSLVLTAKAVSKNVL